MLVDSKNAFILPQHLGPHEDGWFIDGFVEDEKVFLFEALHPTLGKVAGNLQGSVYVVSPDTWKNFSEKYLSKETGEIKS
jgi:hypothetical protein